MLSYNGAYNSVYATLFTDMYLLGYTYINYMHVSHVSTCLSLISNPERNGMCLLPKSWNAGYFSSSAIYYIYSSWFSTQYTHEFNFWDLAKPLHRKLPVI